MLNVACFVQSCLTDADFVIFSNYCLIGTRRIASPCLCQKFIRNAKRLPALGAGTAQAVTEGLS